MSLQETNYSAKAVQVTVCVRWLSYTIRQVHQDTHEFLVRIELASDWVHLPF